jgi:hypothetical protein
MFILTMTPFCCYEVPSIGLNTCDDVTDFQEYTSGTAYFIGYVCTLSFSLFPTLPGSTPLGYGCNFPSTGNVYGITCEYSYLR